MTRDSASDNHSAHVIVEAAEILQKLTPSRLATLLFLTDDSIETQTEMADILDVSTSTITTYLQTLENLSLSLTKRGRHYEITAAGDRVIDLFNSMLGYLGENLSAIDWEDENEKERIGEQLSPLHTSRSIIPYFVLHSIGHHSAVEGRLDRFVTPRPVLIEDVVDDVKKRQEQRGKSSTRKQIRGAINRSEEYGTIEIDGETIKLEDKGQEHIQLLDRLIDLLEEDNPAESSGDTSSVSSPSTQQSIGIRSDISPETATNRVGLQLGLQSFHSKQEETDHSELSTLVPAYCISSSNGERDRTRSPSTVLPLMPTTSVEDLADQIHRIGREHGNVQLELFWTELPSESPDADSSEQSQLQR